MDSDAWWNSLPRKAIGAGCLLFDNSGNLLIVKPTYKLTWQLPGGVVEASESPWQACVREVHEELGLHITLQRLLCVDYVHPADHGRESMQFIFLAEPLGKDRIAQIKLPAAELSDYRLVPPPDALPLLNERLRRRVAHCLHAVTQQQTLYLENQQQVH